MTMHRKIPLELTAACLLSAFLLHPGECPGQSSASAPLNAPAGAAGPTQTPAQAPAQAAPAPGPGLPSLPPPPATGPVTRLTRQEAEKTALLNNPNIHISQLIARVQHEVVRERRADELPNLNGNVSGVAAAEGTRLASGSLTASRLLNHAGGGVQLTQLITDFGRTHNLVASAKLLEKARLSDAEATRGDIVLATDQIFYQVIEAQDTLKVAQQTVSSRQTLTDQVSALTSAKLRSELDLSFAQVNLSQAKLLTLDAQNNLDASKAALGAVLGYDRQVDFELVDDSSSLPPLAPNVDALVAQAIQNRPDLLSLRFNEQAAEKFRKAQSEQRLPSINALGVVGGIPAGSSTFFSNNYYGAVGANLSIPIFNGFRFSAQTAEAALQAQAATEQTRLLRDQVVRDVRTAWLTANTGLQRVAVTAELVKQADTALSLAQTRYDLGLSSIVELSQAQLQQTQAAIANADAHSQYSFALASIAFQTGVQP